MASMHRENEDPAWKAFDTSTEAGRLLKKLYGGKAPPVNVPLPRRSKKATPPAGQWRPGGGQAGAVDPRKATRSKAREASVKTVRRARGESQYSAIDFVERKKAGNVIKVEIDDAQMRIDHYRPAYQRPVATEDEKNRLNEICTFRGGKSLPEEMTFPAMDMLPSEFRAKQKEQERIDKARRRRAGMPEEAAAAPAAGSSLPKDSSLVEHICGEIEERRQFLEDMEGLGGQSAESKRQTAMEIRMRVLELKRLDPERAEDYGA